MTVLHAILSIFVFIGSSSDTVYIMCAKMGRCRLNEAKLGNNIYIYCCKQRHFFLLRRNLRENVHRENTVPSFHDTYISIFHYLPTLLTATPLLPPPRPVLHGSDASFNHYTKSAFMHTTPFFPVFSCTGGHSRSL